MRLQTRLLLLSGLAAFIVISGTVPAIGFEGEPETKPAETKLEMKPTTLGVRFTPAMATGISKMFVREMKGRYDLNDKQADGIREIISRQLMTVVSENAETGRDMIEKMMETMINNDGAFPPDAAKEFATIAKPVVPAIRSFFTKTSAEISKELTIKQRLKFTGDIAAATAGLVVFENRMKRWEEGKVPEGANPFYDPADHDPSLATSQPEPTDEHPDYRRARQGVERSMQWQVDLDERWERYVDRTVDFYDLDEAQTNAAQAVLKDCRQRVAAIKTPEWREAILQNRIAQRLTWRTGGGTYTQGPWMFKLEADFEKMMQPLNDLDRELKRRLGEIPDSKQRAVALEKVRKALAEKGLERLPAR
jgi:hypothetical protein